MGENKWTPNQALRADATDGQIKARYNECYADSGIKRSDLICHITREFADAWLQRYADSIARRDALMAEGRELGLIVDRSAPLAQPTFREFGEIPF